MKIRITVETLDNNGQGNSIYRDVNVEENDSIGATADDMLDSLLKEF